MTINWSISRLAIAGTLAFAGMALTTQAFSAQADLDLLQSYVGDWRGTGTLSNAGQPGESVRCRLGVTKSSAEKINFSGRCAIAGTTLSMAGTMAYLPSADRYEAVLTSNTTFSGNAVGRRRGSNVTFNLQSTDDDGLTSNVRAEFGLIDGNIEVNFAVSNADGADITAKVPFNRE